MKALPFINTDELLNILNDYEVYLMTLCLELKMKKPRPGGALHHLDTRLKVVRDLQQKLASHE